MEAAIPVCNSGLQCTSKKDELAGLKTSFHAGVVRQQQHTVISSANNFAEFRDNLKKNNLSDSGNCLYKSLETQKKLSENAPKLQMCNCEKSRPFTVKFFKISVRTLALAFCFGGFAGFMRLLLSVLPPDFSDRWHKLVHEKEHENEDGVIRKDSNAGTIIYDRYGIVIATIVPPTSHMSGGKDGRTLRPLRASDVPCYMWQAVVASEDRRFFEHRGIDPKGIARAALSMTAGGGGSTITQQLVKNVFLTNERKWARKIAEIFLALLVERQMSKWEILHSYLNKVTLEEALVKSLNVPTVKLCAEIGVDKVYDMARALGIKTPLPYELSLSLGGCEVTPLQLATAYSTIAAGGYYHKPYIISRVETGDGHLLEEVESNDGNENTVVDEHAISEIRQLLQAVVERGTGRAARLGRPCAGKTGTSDEYRDVWFAGFTPEFSCVVWFGYDNNSTVGGLHPATGASHAAPVWRRLMKIIHKGLPINNFHDIGSDKYGMRSPRFKRKSRRAYRIGLQEVRKALNQNDDKAVLREIWDWENASSIWEEKEKMKEWTENQLKKVFKIRAARAPWRSILQKSEHRLTL